MIWSSSGKCSHCTFIKPKVCARPVAVPGLPGTRVLLGVHHPICPPPTHPCSITGTRNAEPDACLGAWQAAGAAAISKLDRDSASDAGSLHWSRADSLKIAELSRGCTSPARAPREAGQLPPAESAEGPTAHPLGAAFQL